VIRSDLTVAYALVAEHVTSPGSWWDGAERRHAATVALAAFADTDPLPPWLSAAEHRPDLAAGALGPAVVDAVYRMTAAAETLTPAWYGALVADLDELAYVELCGVVAFVAAIASFHRTMGLPVAPLPAATPGRPTAARPGELGRSPRNWVPVAAPAGTRAAVLDALSAVPGEYDLLWRHLAPAQYMADEDMVDLAWTRGTVTRPQAELLAARVSALRQCFF
jgi:hypothetical protein